MRTPVRFNGAQGIARFVTLQADPISYETAMHMVHALAGYPDTPAHDAALDRLAAEAFPRRGWRERLVNPRKHLGLLANDLQLHLVRTLCPVAEGFHGLG
jgi:hypothetical protein